MAERLRLVLRVSPACDACEDARELLASLAAAMRFEWSVAEADAGELTPVVATAAGTVLAEAPLDAGALADAIRAAMPPDEPPD